jgi:hypothetical protein
MYYIKNFHQHSIYPKLFSPCTMLLVYLYKQQRVYVLDRLRKPRVRYTCFLGILFDDNMCLPHNFIHNIYTSIPSLHIFLYFIIYFNIYNYIFLDSVYILEIIIVKYYFIFGYCSIVHIYVVCNFEGAHSTEKKTVD